MNGEGTGARATEDDRRELEERLQRQTRLLAEEARRKEHFLSMLAHELRNPLGPIRNAVKLLEELGDDVDADLVARAARTIDRQVAVMARVLDDLSDIDRITRGKVELRREVTDLGQAIRRGVESASPEVERHHHALTLEVPPDPLWIRVDPARVVQIVTNLLVNAARYTERGGHIRISLRREGEEAAIRVSDNGIGIPRDVLPQIFDLYKQVERSWYRAQGGLGIGLSLVRLLTEQHGGRVVAESEGPGKGSEFVVRFPVQDGVHLEPEPRAVGETRVPDDRPRRILVVDDNEDARESLRLLLEARGHRVETAGDGPGAIRIAAGERPEVAILDLGLPGMDGFDLASRLREGGEPISLVALTGYDTAEDRVRAREAGIDEYLLKPLDLARFEEILSRLP